MRGSDLARLVALAIIWSLSFVFVRVLVPVMGPLWTATLRVLIAGIALVAWFAVTRVDAGVRRHWRAYLFVGALNCALPFVLFAYAAVHLPASYLVILNAATPMFAALGAAVWLGDALTPTKVAGLALGAAGVALVSGAGPVTPDAPFIVAVAASLGAALCYALAGVWLKRKGAALSPIAMAGWSQLFAAFVLLPFAATTPLPVAPSTLVIVDLLALALICSGVAYLLYYRLVADVGPTRATTVTFLMPAFGMAWGALFLDERVTPAMLAGAAMIVGGTAAVLRKGTPRAVSA
jgi:drug/metabolite transporter (DMT)-like permease